MLTLYAVLSRPHGRTEFKEIREVKQMQNLKLKWRQIADLMRDAADALPVDAQSAPKGNRSGIAVQHTLEQFNEFLSHNELELAWDTLAEMAQRLQAGAAAWLLLARAAALMELNDRMQRAGKQLLNSIPREEPKYRLVYQRRYRTPSGKIVWSRPASAPQKGLKAV